MLLNSKEVNNSTIPEQFPNQQFSGEKPSTVEPSHLPEGMILPFDVSLFVWLLDQLAELLPLDNLDYKAIEDLFARGREGVEQVGKTLQQILEDIRWKASVNKSLKPHFEHKIPYKIASILAILTLLLIACGISPGITDASPTLPPPGVQVTEGSGIEEEALLTDQTTAETVEINYGRYEDFQEEINPILESQWGEIARQIIDQQLAFPANIEVIDVSGSPEQALLKIIGVEENSGYPADPDGTTYVTISKVEGHQGEILFVTLSGANSVLTGNQAVTLAIGNDGLPVALDQLGSNARVVAFVNSQGFWEAGQKPLAAEADPGIPQATPTGEGEEAEPVTPDSGEVSQETRAFMETLPAEILAKLESNHFPLNKENDFKSYSLDCVQTGDATIYGPKSEGYAGDYPELGGERQATAIIPCAYNDSSGELRQIYVVVGYQSESEQSAVVLGTTVVEENTFMPRLVEAGLDYLGFTRGALVSLSFVDEITPESSDFLTGSYLNPAVEIIHPPGSLNAFIATGDPNSLPKIDGKPTIVALYVIPPHVWED
jgi:hypothetical protein